MPGVESDQPAAHRAGRRPGQVPGLGLVGWGRDWRAWPGERRYVLPLMSCGLLIQKAPHTPERR